MVLRALLLASVCSIALAGCASSSKSVHIQSSPAIAAAPAEKPAEDPLLPQDPMSAEPETPMAADIVSDPQAEDYVQLTSATGSVSMAANGQATYLLDSGDRIRVFVYGQPNLTRTYPVDGAGFIAMPLIGTVKAQGLTTYDLAASITELLGRDYVRNPEVAVEVVTYRPFNIIGEVRNAGQFAFQPGMTVETAVAVAGGFTPRADQHGFKITRKAGGATEEIEVMALDQVQPGDTVRVGERFF
ncbi:MAG: polysaccharide biosynthesis/export family protein [Hyphomicrobiaceae bacterium]